MTVKTSEKWAHNIIIDKKIGLILYFKNEKRKIRKIFNRSRHYFKRKHFQFNLLVMVGSQLFLKKTEQEKNTHKHRKSMHFTDVVVRTYLDRNKISLLNTIRCHNKA